MFATGLFITKFFISPTREVVLLYINRSPMVAEAVGQKASQFQLRPFERKQAKHLILFPVGVEAGIAARELEIDTSTHVVCTARLTLHATVLLHSCPTAEELLREPEFSASWCFFFLQHGLLCVLRAVMLTVLWWCPVSVANTVH